MTFKSPLEKSLAEVDVLEHNLKHSLDRLYDQLHQALDWQRQFEAGAAHELRTPIAGLQAQLEEARLHPGDVDLDNLLERALSDVDRLHGIVKDLFLLAQLHTASQPHDPLDVDLSQLVRTTLAQRTDRLEVKVEAEPGVVVHGVAAKLQCLLSELLDNAQRYGRHLVLVQVQRREDRVELVVANDGPGINKADRERIFEPFARVDSARSRHQGGSGLGLAIVRNIARTHDCSIQVEDSPSGGAAFVIRFPPACE
jgi:signal transduction histidine kinase